MRNSAQGCHSGPDLYLSEVAARYESHRFLAKATGLVYERQVEELVRILGIGRTAPLTRVLDWGCGKCHISYLLNRSGVSVTSCDLSSESIDSAFGQEIPIALDHSISVVPLHDPIRLPFDDASFEGLTSFGVLEHVADDRRSLLEIKRVVVSGGIFYCSFLPYRLSWTQFVARRRGDGYHDRLYTVRATKKLLQECGFVILHMRHAQLFPKNSVPRSSAVERLDDWLCRRTVLRYFATNLVVIVRCP